MNPYPRHSRRSLLLQLLVAGSLAVTLPQPVWAYDENSTSAVNTDVSGLALKGFDPVSYQSASGPTPGQAQWVADFEGARYQFSSSANRDAFRANPARYAPAFGGFCAMGVALEKKLDVDPKAWRVVDGKLYLNVNLDVQKRWLDDMSGHIRQADGNWPKLKSKAPKTL